MGSCRICGDVTRWASRLCEECVADLGAYDTVQSRSSDHVISIRRYGSAASEAPLDTGPGATVSAQLATLLLLLGCVAVLVAGFWIAWQLSAMP